MQLYVIRHGESVANDEGRIPEPNTPLTERGIEQANSVAEYLRGKQVEVLYSSPLERALQTSKIIARELGLIIAVKPELSEMDYGEIVGKDISDDEVDKILSQLSPNNPDYRIPGGGTFHDLQSRINQAVGEILNSGKNVVASVGHKQSNGILLGGILGLSLEKCLDIEQGNNEVYLIDTATKDVTNIRIGKGLRTW